jgi:hypothetical protein
MCRSYRQSRSSRRLLMASLGLEKQNDRQGVSQKSSLAALCVRCSSKCEIPCLLQKPIRPDRIGIPGNDLSASPHKLDRDHWSWLPFDKDVANEHLPHWQSQDPALLATFYATQVAKKTRSATEAVHLRYSKLPIKKSVRYTVHMYGISQCRFLRLAWSNT